jgi:hypothetical protein
LTPDDELGGVDGTIIAVRATSCTSEFGNVAV